MTSDKLYGLAFEYKKTRLWKVLGDMEVFAVKLSADRIGYISIMGQAGGYCALGLFIGDKGFNSFRTIAATDPETLSLREYHEHILQHECLQCYPIKYQNELLCLKWLESALTTGQHFLHRIIFPDK